MKKLLLSVVLFALAFSLIAQDTVLTSKNGIPILPVKGDLAIGIDAVPFFEIFKESGDSPGFNFTNNIPMIAVKYFTADNRAVRMECIVKYTSVNVQFADKEVANSFGVNIGHEWRRGSSRVQGYTGVQGGILYAKTKSTDDNDDVFSETSTFGFGVEGFLGAEYFVAPKLSIGGQFTWGPMYVMFTDNETEEKTTGFDISAKNAYGALMLTFHF